MKRGVPDVVYVDNGKVFISRWFRLGCAKLGIRHIHTQPYSPEAKGKIERFNRTVESFLAELKLKPPQTLSELNQLFAVWMEEGYNHHPHSALDNETLVYRFQKDPRRLRFASLEECREAFLWAESRRVDKTGCIKLQGRLYEIGLEWVKKTVDLRFDPFDLETVEFWHNGQKQGLARPLVIQEYNVTAVKDKSVQGVKASQDPACWLCSKQETRPVVSKNWGAIPFRYLEGGKKVVIVDETHLLDREMLEEIRFLLNFRMDSYNPMGLILVGQPELRRILQLQVYEAIAQRVNMRYHLPPMERKEVKNYVAHHYVFRLPHGSGCGTKTSHR